ncbi:MAG: hypothetical protein KJ729_05985, partial [Euryarchaeota archaeon]|nr:hypothetical protein [Euryarchaeota archaeon]
MKNPGKNKAKKASIRLSVPLLIVLLVLFASVLIIYSTPVLTEEKRTSGNLSFTDSAGSLIYGAIEISMTGAPSGGRSNVNYINWSNAPNACIYFDALGTKNISINLRISEDSPNGRVSLEDYGATMPGSVDQSAPGIPVKYVELHSTGVSFANADVSIHYTNAELNEIDENSLVIYIYDGGAWTELPTRVDAAKNIVSAAVVTLSVFAISARASERIEIRDTRGMPVTSEVKTYDEARTLKKQEKTSTLSSANIPDWGELEVDAIKTKNVAVRLKVKAPSSGEIVLDNFGKNNPVTIPAPGNIIKYVDISAVNLSFEYAEIKIYYTDAELGGQDENRLVIYHYKNGAWSDLSTGVDAANNTLTASSDSLSIFAASMVGGFSQLKLAANRGAVFGPWTNYGNTDFDDEVFTIRAYALKLNSTNKPESGIDINFTIYSGNGILKATEIRTTDINGIANFSYNTRGQFTAETDPDFGVWRITAVQVSDANINATTYFRIDTPTNNDRSVCHTAPGTGSSMGRTCSSVT